MYIFVIVKCKIEYWAMFLINLALNASMEMFFTRSTLSVCILINLASRVVRTEKKPHVMRAYNDLLMILMTFIY